MNRLNRMMLIAALAGGTSLVAVAADAQSPPDPPQAERGDGPHGHMHAGMMEMHGAMERLKLTDDQKKKIEDIHYTHRKRAITTRAEMEAAHLDLGRLMGAEAPDARAINAQIDKISQLRASLEKEHVAGMLEMRGVLTPEQRKEWRGMHGGMHGWGPGMRGMHGTHGMHGMSGPGGMGEGMHGDLMPGGPDDSEDGPDSM